jgi:DNA polymerase bacteriophage-type
VLEQEADERTPGATFALGDILFFDFESRSGEPINNGTDRYATRASAIVLAWAIGDGIVTIDAVQDFDAPLKWDDMPNSFRNFFKRVKIGAAKLCAHNAAFDRAIWNRATIGFPPLEPWMMIDTRVQALASGLPSDLKSAAKIAGGALKDEAGRDLINLFTQPDSTATPQSHRKEWLQFLLYAGNDIEAMRSVFLHTRQLPIGEWQEYWAAERINDYGVTIDMPMVQAAALMAQHDAVLTSRELKSLTNGWVNTVNQVKAITEWLLFMLPPMGQEILTEREEEIDLETGEVAKAAKHALTRNRVIRLIAYLDSLEPLSALLRRAKRVLQIRLYGGSKTPAKYGKMLKQQVDGVIRGQYVFNGASQTGRFSSKGVQIHNLARDPLSYEIDAIDALTAGATAEEFAVIGDDTPISRKLSLLIRPSLIPSAGHVFAWGDWSNIEARLVPWLAKDPEADKRLDIFRAVDRGEEKYDIYTRTAAQLSGLPLAEAKESSIRQRGKVAELAAGFGGGANALLSMAASYGLHMTPEEAATAIKVWRENNQWAPRFWGKHDGDRSYGLWGALNTAMERPGEVIAVGRVHYVYLRPFLGGSLLCRLPSGRWLTYRRIHWERVEDVDEDGHIVDVRYELMFSREQGRVKLWPGLACENIVQATAADILRGTLARLDHEDYDAMPVCMHTHDEVVVETLEEHATQAANALRAVMEQGFAWSEGLPIAAETVVGRWYTKSKGSIGL